MKGKTTECECRLHSTDHDRQLRAVFETAVEGIITIDERGLIDLFNAAAERMFGYRRDEVVGRNVSRLMPEPQASKHDQFITRYLQTGQARIIGIGREVTGKRKNGSTFPIDLSVSEVSGTHPRQFAGVVRDISARKQIEQQLSDYRDHLERLVAERTEELAASNRDLARMARIDALTEIPNRRSFDETLITEWRRMLREGKPLSLLMGDIDCFKQYNDCYGHLHGDRCLQQVAGILNETFQRPSDTVARYGGEEFGVILPDTSASHALTMAHRAQDNLRRHEIAHPDSPVSDHVTISIGLATALPGSPDTTAHELLGRADRALLKAKRRGRNRVVSAEPERLDQPVEVER